MDISRTQEKYEFTPVLANESGYVSATPSPWYNDSSESGSCSSTRRPTINSISETPLTSQKFGRKSAVRKYFLQQNCDNQFRTFSENITEKVYNSSDYSCVSNENDVGVNTPNASSEENGALTEVFSHLLVDESVCKTSERFPVHFELDDEVFSPDSKIIKLPTSLKTKNSSYHGHAVKKFKHDCNSRRSSGRFESLGSVSTVRKNYYGVTYFDILANLHDGFPGLVSQVLCLLSSQDLVTACKVSPEWYEVCVSDPAANRRRLAHLEHVKHAKENVALNDVKQTSPSLNVSLSANRGLFKDIQNTERRDSNASASSSPRSPPVSPSKVRFNIFVKAGFALNEGTYLVRCPRCSHPSQVSSLQAFCQAVGCQYKFCVTCLCDVHEGQPCPGRSIFPNRRKCTQVCSKESRRNLRRL